MPLNQPYDPHYNPKVYVPKLTEEQRRARATPLENLRGLRFRSEAPAASVDVPVPAEAVTQPPAPVDVPAPAESVPQAPAPQDNATPQGTPVSLQVPESRSVAIPEEGPVAPGFPTALEVLCAEFPEIFASHAEGPLSLLPRLRWVEDAPSRGMQSPAPCSAATSTRSSPQTLRPAPPGRRRAFSLVPKLSSCHYP